MSSATLDSPAVPLAKSVFPDAPAWDHAAVPAWFGASQRAAWDAFARLPLPSRRDEAWRFADLKHLALEGYVVDASAAAAPRASLALLDHAAARFVLGNGHFQESASHLPGGVQVLRLAEALAIHGDRLQAVLQPPETGLGSAKFAALHHAQLADAVVIAIAAGQELEHPIEIVHLLEGPRAASFPRTIVLAEAKAKVAVLEHHLSQGPGGLSIGAAQLVAAEGSTIHYALLNRLGAGSKAMHFSTVAAGRDAQVRHSLFNLGSGWARTECRSLLEGPGSRSEMYSVSLAADGQEVDQRTLQDHLSPHSYSDLLYKNVLFDTSRTIFAGLIKVDEGAHGTDAYQKCRNLLLSDDCEANSMPGLEINADQVKCSHGSTTGRIAEDELFYFESRGIPRLEATRLIAVGFAQEVVAKIGHPAMEALIGQAVEERFAQQGA